MIAKSNGRMLSRARNITNGADKNNMSKNIIAGVIILGISTGIMLVVIKNKYYQPAPTITTIDAVLLEKNISELNTLDGDMALFNQDDIVSDEIVETLSEVGEITPATGLNEEENNLAGLSQDINNLAQDESLFEEINQAANDSSI